MWGLQGSALKDQNESGIGVHTFDPTTWGRGKQISEFQVSLCYVESLCLIYLFFKELKGSEPVLLEGLAESKVSITFSRPFRNPKTAIHHVQITTKKWYHEGSPQVGIQLSFICRQHFHQVGYTVSYGHETVISTTLRSESILTLFLLSLMKHLPYYELISGDHHVTRIKEGD